MRRITGCVARTWRAPGPHAARDLKVSGVAAETWQLPVGVAELAELLFKRVDAAAGNFRLELFASDGHLRTFRLQEEGGRDALARFDEPPREQP
jgi:hypothetical protein